MGGLGRFLVEITLPSEIFTSSKIAAKKFIPNLKDSRDSGGISFFKHELKVLRSESVNSVANIFERRNRGFVRFVQNMGFYVCLQRQEEQDLNDPQLLDWRRDPEKPVILDLFGAGDEGWMPSRFFVCGC